MAVYGTVCHPQMSRGECKKIKYRIRKYYIHKKVIMLYSTFPELCIIVIIYYVERGPL